MEKHPKHRDKMVVEYEEDNFSIYANHNAKMPRNVLNVFEKIYEIPIDNIKAKKQCRIEIGGVEVYFPYSPYENQLNYMEKVIEACNTGNLAALESPTGTGKTLCLLCASLGWLRAKRKKMREEIKEMSDEQAADYIKSVPFIYYTSRTHTQLANVIKELKKTCYLPKTATLSSRDQMCVNAAVKAFTGNSLNLKCKQVRIRKECKYFFGTEKLSLTAYENTDIEELYALGSKSGFCPFFFQRNKKEIADVLFLPYNYIFEAKFRKALKLEMKNAVVLIDEAHNMESVCESSKSFEFSIKMIDECLSDFKGIKTVIEHADTTLSKDSVLKSVDVKSVRDQESILTNIKSYLKSFMIKEGTNWPNYGLKLTPKEFFDIFYEGSKRGDKNQTLLINGGNENPNSRITPENIQSHIELLRKIDTGISDELQKSSIISNYIDILDLVSTLSLNYFSILQSNDKNPLNLFINNYKIFLNDIDDTTNKNNFKQNMMNNNSSSKIRTLFLYCFNPGFGFDDVIKSGAQTVIITSGTLSPMESIETELKCNFKIKLENKHVIDKCQANFSILTNSFRRKTNFRFDAGNRNNTEMIEELGNTISDLAKVTPGGILVFFTSYQFMNNCVNIWAEKEILSEIEKSKEIFKDVQDGNKNKIILKNFTETCKSSSEVVPSYRKAKKGGILFSVCRGSSSEGIDFSDDMARMVIIVGIPYPNLGDVKVNLKKEFIDEYNMKYFNFLDKRINIRKLTSSEWYTQSATKAVNQALGRVIRHIYDYGSMILIDGRYKELLYKKVFSAWLRDSCKIYEDNKLLVDTKSFFDNMKSYVSEKRLKKTEQNVNENIVVNSNNNTNTNFSANNLNSNSNLNLTNKNNSNNTTTSNIMSGNLNPNNKMMQRNFSNSEYEDKDLNSILNRNQSALIKRSKKTTDLPDNNNNSNNINIKPQITPISNNNNINYNFNSLYSNNNNITNNVNRTNTTTHNETHFSDNNFKNTNNASNAKLPFSQSTTDIIEDIKSQINNLDNIKQDISLDMKKINNVTSKTININFNQNNNYLIYPGRQEATLNDNKGNIGNFSNTDNTLNKVNNSSTQQQLKFMKQNQPLNLNLQPAVNNNPPEPEEENIFDTINPDELMDIINQNITYFEDDANSSGNKNAIKTPRLSTSKKKVFRQYPTEESKLENGKNSKASISQLVNGKSVNVNTSNIPSNNVNTFNNHTSNNLSQQFSLMTPAKNTTELKEEIKSDIIVKKLLELKERDQLDHLLEKYNLKLCFDSQPIIENNSNLNSKTNNAENKSFEKDKKDDYNKKIECPICFEYENKKFSAAKCGHILCSDCWDKCLATKFECPMCKKKVRLNTLVNIFI